MKTNISIVNKTSGTFKKGFELKAIAIRKSSTPEKQVLTFELFKAAESLNLQSF